ncbi:MAG: hypothetical protein GY827_04630 [Cytophagales bacterium]|nr:hypothetical protein [Cytophagales bacterium]
MDNAINNFLQALNQDNLQRMERSFPTSVERGWVDEYKAIPGRTNIKIVMCGKHYGGQTSAKYFVKPDGKIYKAASWKAPSKTVVGELKDFR